MQPITPHLHNGTDSSKLFAGDALKNAPQEAVTSPTGGATIDTEARTAIDDLLVKLQFLGIIK